MNCLEKVIEKKTRVYKKCPHGRRKKQCKNCSPENVCEHNHIKKVCVDCRKSAGTYLCEHGIPKYRCLPCGGKKKVITRCDHKNDKFECVVCSPHLACEHERIKRRCGKCRVQKRHIKCQHGREQRRCTECGNEKYIHKSCEHNKIKGICKVCIGNSCCACGKLKNQCSIHGGSRLCINCKSTIKKTKYGNHCGRCFVNLFPEDPKSISYRNKPKEYIVRRTLDESFPDLKWTHDKVLWTGNCDCTHKRRLDHQVIIGNTMLVVETDEFAHVGYDEHDEEIRYSDVAMIYTGKFIWCRFNVDSNKEARGSKTELEHKLRILVETIRESIRRIEAEENSEMCEIIKLFY